MHYNYQYFKRTSKIDYNNDETGSPKSDIVKFYIEII